MTKGGQTPQALCTDNMTHDISRSTLEGVRAEIANVEAEISAMQKTLADLRGAESHLATKVATQRLKQLPEKMAPNTSDSEAPISQKLRQEPESKATIVRNVIRTFHKPWTYIDVYEALRAAGGTLPAREVRLVVRRLRKLGKIRVYKRGIGRVPSLYHPGVVEPLRPGDMRVPGRGTNEPDLIDTTTPRRIHKLSANNE